MDFYTTCKEEEEALMERFERFKFAVVGYNIGVTDLVPVGKKVGKSA
jgi:hypothetical protein